MRHRSRRQQAGQGLIELALVLPLLVMMMAAAGYFGFAVTAKQRLMMAARQAAREISAASSRDNRKGVNTYVATIGEGTVRDAAASALTGFDMGRVTFRGPSWLRQGLAPLGEYAALMTYTGKAAKGAPAFTAGCVFYGCVIEYRLKELDWLATLMGMGATGLPISGGCVMPGELPMRGYAPMPFGLLDLNKDLIAKAASDPLNDPDFKAMKPLVDPK